MPVKKNKTPIKYTSRDFTSIKKDLVEYAKRHYPEKFRDFSEASFGSLVLDSVAYVGDVLSFYLDYQANESFLDTSIEFNNIRKHTRAMGYKFSGVANSYGTVSLYVLVPANSDGTAPLTSYIPTLSRGTSFASAAGGNFMLTEDVDFNDSKNQIVAARFDDSTGQTTSFAIRAHGQVVSGVYEIAEADLTSSAFERFKRVRAGDSTITEIVKVTDSEGNEYFEVENLSQETVFIETTNRNASSDGVRSIMKPFVASRRFTVERDGFGTISLQFGYGSDRQLPNLSIADPSNVVLERHAKNYFADKSFDPSNLISSDKFGIAPADTSLRIIYRANSNDNANASTDSITKVTRPIFKFDNFNTLDDGVVSSVGSSLESTNEEPITGDITAVSADEVKLRVFDFHAAQNRAVTVQDYITLVYSMPGQFGAVKRCNITRDHGTLKRNLNMYVASEASGGKYITTSAVTKQNLKIWLNNYKMINDTVDILDAKIFNFGIEFTAISEIAVNRFDILSVAVDALRFLFDTPYEIGEHISISSIYRTLNNVPGISDTINVKIVSRPGTLYSSVSHAIEKYTSPDRRFVEIPDNMVAEIKYPNVDITGTIK